MAITAKTILAGFTVLTLVGTSGRAIAQESRWEMIAVNGQSIESGAWLDFNQDGSFKGNNGCNGYQGVGRFEGNGFFVEGPVATTRMGCPSEMLAELEDTVMHVMGSGFVATSYDPTSHSLFLTQENDRIEFKRQDVSTAEDDASDPLLGPTVFDVDYLNAFGLSGPLNIRDEPNTDAARVAHVLAGTLLRSSGCEQRPDRIWCAVEFIDASGTKGWAAGEYLQPAPAMLRASREVFDNIGTLDCLKQDASDTKKCDYGVARDGPSSAVLVVYNAEGKRSNLHFSGPEFIFADDPDGIWTQNAAVGPQDDAMVVTVGNTIYTIPKSVILGENR